MRATIPALLAITAALGCGPEPARVSAIGDADSSEPATLSVAAPLTEDDLPSQLTCVTEVGGGAHEVLRLEVWPGEEGAIASLRGGKQFRNHERGLRHDADVEIAQLPATLTLEDGALRLEATDGDQQLSVTLSQDGLALRGALVHDQCYSREARAVTCWDPLTVFGGFGGFGNPELATFEFASGRCVDAKGDPALNAVPVEMVRETGMGDCADLRGAALNGQDFGYPSLLYWTLRGADLRGAQLHFADLNSAGLQGANLTGLEYGYATVTGSVSDETRLPGSGCQRIDSDNPWAGPRVECAQ